MRISVFHSVAAYVRQVFLGGWSLAGACATILPYLLRWGDYNKEVTEEYPDPVSSKTPDDLPPRSRGLLFNDIDRCSGCRECEKICPARCIKIEAEPGADSAKTWVSVFDIDFSKCVFCGLCVEVCLPGSLTHTRKYEGAAYSLDHLVASYGKGRITPEQKAKWANLRQMSENDQGSLE